MKLHQLRALDAVARLGGIRAAARELGLTQPALTKALKELEITAGNRLLHRGSRGARLTAAGRALLVRARAILHELDCAGLEMRQMAGAQGADIAFAISPVLGEMIMPELLRAFRARYPSVGVRITEAYPEATLPAVAHGQLDFAFMVLLGTETAANVTVERWFEVPNGLVGRRGHPLAKGATLDQLLDQEWVLSNRSDGGQYALMARLCAATGREMPAMLTEVASLSLIKTLLLRSDALALSPTVGLAEFHPDFEAVECPEMEALVSQFGVVRSATSTLTPPAQFMQDQIHRICRGFLSPSGASEREGRGEAALS